LPQLDGGLRGLVPQLGHGRRKLAQALVGEVAGASHGIQWRGDAVFAHFFTSSAVAVVAAWADALAPGAVESDRVTSDAAVSDTVEGDAVVSDAVVSEVDVPDVDVPDVDAALSASRAFSRRKVS